MIIKMMIIHCQLYIYIYYIQIIIIKKIQIKRRKKTIIEVYKLTH